MIKECTAQDLHNKLTNKEKFLLIDCREQDEWNQGHIAEAKLMPLSTFENHGLPLLTDKSAEIVIQCRSGARSLNLCQFLLSHGFTNLTNLRGGIIGWSNAGFEVKA
jgi:rhodanese-related sulfurtransferase